MLELKKCEERLRNIIVLDKQDTPQKISRLLKSELLYLLRNYFDVCAEDFDLNISVNENGNFFINVNAEARTMKIAHIFEK